MAVTPSKLEIVLLSCQQLMKAASLPMLRLSKVLFGIAWFLILFFSKWLLSGDSFL
jgi:hypothetical protein